MLGLVQKVITSILSEQMRRSLDQHSGVHLGIFQEITQILHYSFMTNSI